MMQQKQKGLAMNGVKFLKIDPIETTVVSLSSGRHGREKKRD